MKEKIYTIPVNEAFESEDECPFCYLRRHAEQSVMRYVAGPGASYMEPEVRAASGQTGFCPGHLKKLYDYGNTLGNALMLQTYYSALIADFQRETANFRMPDKKPLFGKRKQSEEEPYWQRLRNQMNTCFICDRVDYNMERYYATFFALLKEPEFRAKVEKSKGFCLDHFSQLLQAAEDQLPNAQREWFYGTVFSLMEENLKRVKEDLDWLIAKYDYRNAGADWKNSRDALQRTMQKLGGGHVADPPYRGDR